MLNSIDKDFLMGAVPADLQGQMREAIKNHQDTAEMSGKKVIVFYKKGGDGTLLSPEQFAKDCQHCIFQNDNLGHSGVDHNFRTA